MLTAGSRTLPITHRRTSKPIVLPHISGPGRLPAGARQVRAAAQAALLIPAVPGRDGRRQFCTFPSPFDARRVTVKP